MLLVRQVNLGRRVLVEAAVFDVPDDADDRFRSIARLARELCADANLLSNGVLSREESLCGPFVDEDDLQTRRGISPVEQSAVADRDTTAGRFSGSVTDPSAASVPDVRVTAQNNETGQKIVETTNGEGRFVLYPLSPGVYTITAQKEGFSTFTIANVKIEVADSIARNITLQVGAVSTSVSVEAEAAALQTDSPAIAATVVRQQIEELPLNGRDFNQLVLLSAGSVDNETGGNNDFGAVALNGNRTYGNSYMLDGTPNTNAFQGRSAAPLSIDLIREFKVYSGVAPAEFGQGGSQVTMVTQSGGNRFHGNLFEYYRGTQLEARDPFNTTGEQSFLRNQFGGSVGGPVLLPRYNGRNRSFFFFNYEGNRQYQQQTRFSSVPLDPMWKGDFSALLPTTQLRDPLTTGRPVIPGNRLDQYLGGARISKIAQQFQPFYGSPTQPGIGNNQVTNVDRESPANQFTIRGDQNLPRNHSVGLRYTQTKNAGFIPNLLGSPGVGREEPLESKNGSLSYTAPLTPRTVSELEARRDEVRRRGELHHGRPPDRDVSGHPGLHFHRPDHPADAADLVLRHGRAHQREVRRHHQLRRGRAFDDPERLHDLRDGLAHGGPSRLKIGLTVERDDYNALQQSNAGGQISFSGSATSNNSTGYAFADFLIGVPSSTQQIPVKSKILLKQTQFSTFVQDDWKSRRK